MRAPLRAGERLGDHVVQRLLGEGSMGAVYAVVHEPTGTLRAAKVLPPPLAGDAHALEVAERFRREGRALARVRHPNVVGVHAAGVREDGLAWFALDLAEGGDLLGHLRAEGPLPVAEVLRLGEGIARGLAQVHAAGIVHRDLKAANILLQGPERRPVLTDFGIALADQDDRLTRPGELLGTPAAMSPEQVLGEHEQVGPPADVWALGALLYHMLVGRPPFQGGSLERLLVAIATTAPEPPRALRPEVPAALEALVLVTLARAPRDRPDAQTVADALATLAGGARPRTPPLVPAPAPRRDRLALAGALLVAGLAVTAVVLRRPPPVDVGVAVAAAQAAARAARTADRLARLGLAPPADPAPLASALAALADVTGRLGAEPGAEPPELSAAQASLVAALAERTATAAIVARDPAAALGALERLTPGARRAALTAAAVAAAPPGQPPGPDACATIDALVASLGPGVERVDALLAGVDAALATGDAPRAERLLGDAEAAAFRAGDDAGAHATAARVPRVLCAAAETYARALEGARAVRALQQAAQRDARLAREGATRASAAAAKRWRDDPDPTRRADALAVLDALLAAGPPAPSAAPAWLGRALQRSDEAGSGWRELLEDLERAARADPEVRAPRSAEGHLHIAASKAAGEKDARGTLRLLCAGLRLGLSLPLEELALRTMLDERALAQALAAARSDDEAWPLRLLRARTVADAVDVTPLTPEGAAALMADARAVLEAPHAPVASRVEARLHALVAGCRLDPAGHGARCEAAWAAGFPDPRRLALVAMHGHLAEGQPAAAAAWGARLRDATLAAAERTRLETLAEGEEAISDLRARLQRAFELHAAALFALDRDEEALALTEGQASREVGVVLVRVHALCRLGRSDEALAEAERALALDPRDELARKALQRAQAARARAAPGNGPPRAEGAR